MNPNTVYVKKNQDMQFCFQYDYKQTWHHSFNIYGVRPAYVYVKNFADSRNIHHADVSVALLRFLLNVSFATKSQIFEYLNLLNISTEEAEPLLERFLESRVLNAFILSRYPLDHIPEDALLFYCLDFGGKHLLSHYGQADLVEWTSVKAIRGVEYISKYLITNQFYLTVLKSVQKDLVYFDSFVNFNIGKKDMQVSAAFQIKNGHTKRDFVLEVIRDYDLPLAFQRKAEKIDALLNHKYIRKYYQLDPVFLLLTDNDKAALECGEIYYRNTNSDQFRLLTLARIAEGFNDESFLKFNPESNTITSVKSALFCRDDE